jgi:hypothetical protein
MSAMERLRGLDRRAETRFQRKYDTEPPVWLKYSWLLALLGPMTLPLSIATSPVVSVVVLSVVLFAYSVVAFRWSAKHRF